MRHEEGHFNDVECISFVIPSPNPVCGLAFHTGGSSKQVTGDRLTDFKFVSLTRFIC
jgi:hypothetical protein